VLNWQSLLGGLGLEGDWRLGGGCVYLHSYFSSEDLVSDAAGSDAAGSPSWEAGDPLWNPAMHKITWA
jgi:hypothetical protein